MGSCACVSVQPQSANDGKSSVILAPQRQSIRKPVPMATDAGQGDKGAKGDKSETRWEHHFDFPLLPGLAAHCLWHLYGIPWGQAPCTGPQSKGEADSKIDAAFGEILPEGLAKLLDPTHLNASHKHTRVLFDLGAGNGRLLLQAFLGYENLVETVGVEIVLSRYTGCVGALKRLAQAFPDCFEFVCFSCGAKRPRAHGSAPEMPGECAVWRGSSCRLTMVRHPKTKEKLAVPRVLDWRHGDILEMRGEIPRADIVLCPVSVPDSDALHRLADMLCDAKTGARLLLCPTYQQFPKALVELPGNGQMVIHRPNKPESARTFSIIAPGDEYRVSWNSPDYITKNFRLACAT